MPPKLDGRRNAGRMSRKIRTQFRQIRRELNGTPIKAGSNEPPVVNTRPYYPYVVSLDLASAGVETLISVKTLVSIIATNLGLSAQAQAIMTIKIKSVKGWAYQYGPMEDRVAINGELSSLIPNVSDFDTQASVNPVINYPVLYKFLDFGTLNRPAHFGYMYPRQMQNMPLTSSANFNLLSVATNSNSGTLHFHLEWSTTDIATHGS